MKRWPIVILFYRNPYKNFLTSQFGHHFLVIVTVADHEVFVGNWLLSLYIMLVQIFRNFMGGESVSRSHRSGWFRLRLNGRFLVFGLGFTSPCARFWAHLDLSSTVLIIVFFSLYFIKELDIHPWQYCFGTCLVYTIDIYMSMFTHFAILLSFCFLGHHLAFGIILSSKHSQEWRYKPYLLVIVYTAIAWCCMIC